jgi:large subunit ribosomal protein L25
LHVSDVTAPEGAKIVRHGSLNPVIVAVAEPKAEEEIVAAAPAAAPAKGKGKKDEKQNKK